MGEIALVADGQGLEVRNCRVMNVDEHFVWWFSADFLRSTVVARGIADCATSESLAVLFREDFRAHSHPFDCQTRLVVG